MIQNPEAPKLRIQLIDAIRGFALAGILLLHAIEHFDLIQYPESTGLLTILDPWVTKVTFFIFAGKSYSIFSILFGLSFFIQLQNQAEKGEPFTLRFVWRLCVLFVLGYILSLVYIGEILTLFALLGLPLVFFQRLGNKVLLFMAALLIAQLPTLYLTFLSFKDTDFVFQQDWSAWADVTTTFSEGSFLEVIKFNAFKGHLAKWQFMINEGRYLQITGLLTLGLVLGRKRYFENAAQYGREVVIVFFVSILAWSVFYGSSFIIPLLNLKETQAILLSMLSASYSTFAFTIVLLSGFVWLYLNWIAGGLYNVLAAFGRMSLSNYIIQPLIGVPFFYGFGLGMYTYLGVTYSIIFGFIFLAAQLYFSKAWIKRFYYGPAEWLWRALTFFDFKQKFKR